MIPQQLQQRGIRFVLLEKQGKKPFQTGWQNKSIEFDNPELLSHLANGGNYGVMGGGEKNLLIVDFDDKELQEKALKQLPETFTVKTGSGLLHLYFFSNQSDSFKIFNEEMDTLADVQGTGKQVVGAGSIHPNGNRYEVVKDMDIQFIDYAELKAVIMSYDKKTKPTTPKPIDSKAKHIEDSFLDDVKRRVRVSDALSWMGVDTSRNPTQCPFHDSKGGKCLGFNDETCHCFHCEGSWNVFSLVMRYKNCDFKEALNAVAELGGMQKELEESRKRYIDKMNQENIDEFKQIRNRFLEIIADDKLESSAKWGEASELLSDFVQGKLWLYTTKDDVKTETWVYNEGIYIPNGKSEVKELLRKTLDKYYSAFIVNLVLNKIEADTYIDIDKFFKSRYENEVPVMNGVLNIVTLDLQPFNPEKIFFNKMPVAFDKTKQCPKIDNFIKDILPSEKDTNTMYELAGFGLMDTYMFEKAFMFHGDGRNGKGKLIELFKRLFGVENCCSVHLNQLKEDNFSLSELFGKKLNLAGDIGHTDLKETNMFKSLTARDLVSAHRKFLRDLHFQNYAKFVFACNELPMVYDLSKGFWDRWILIDFPYTFVTQEEYNTSDDKLNMKIRDENVIEKITNQDELSGFLNKALEGIANLKKNRGFSKNENSNDLKQRWVRKSNSFIAFCWDNVIDNYEGRISKKMLRKRYSEYCKAHKVSVKSDFVMKKVLLEEYGASEVRGLGDFNVRDDSWEGITWKK